MKSNPNGRSWNPTITLAKLFEEQNQFFDALAAYELIDQHDSSPQIREKIEALHMRILTDPTAKYDPRIEKLFSPEELAYLKIINHSAFLNLNEVAERISDGFPDADRFLDAIDAGEFNESLDEAQELSDILQEIEEQAMLTNADISEQIEEHTLTDFIIALLSRYAKDTPLTQISFSDLIGIFVSMHHHNSKDT
jgi:hypothetical protein